MSFQHAATARSPALQPFVFGATTARDPSVDERRSRRARANWAARLINEVGNVNIGRVCDVSEGGFGVMSAVNMPVGSLLEVALAVPNGGAGDRSVPVRCRVRVISCSFAGIQSRLGVQFLALPKESRIAIRNYVISHS